MPRIRLSEYETRSAGGDLVVRLSEELKRQRDIGQPTIYEQEFDGGRIRTTVIWDAWDRLPLEDRTSVIHEAYAQAEGPDYRAKIVLASGLTVPEAEAAGMLPFRILTALRPGDPVSWDECRQAMIDAGASTLLDPQSPQLRFATQEEADQALQKLVKRLPNSRPVWVITQDIGKVDDWLDR